MNKKIVWTAIIVGLNCFNIFGQSARKLPTPQPQPEVKTVDSPLPQKKMPPLNASSSRTATPVALDTILNEAQKQVENYEQTFKDLLATETKTFIRYDKNGNSKDPTIVESDFLVYQSPKDANVTTELRNVVKVDGKLVPDSQSRSEKFLAELQKASTLESELEKIEKEGARYDKTLEVYGLTLFEGGVLDEKLRPFFDFKLLGSENYQGNDLYVISYQQTKASPFVTLNGGTEESRDYGFDFKLEVPGALKNSDAFLRGKLWIDKQTYQIRRENRELTVQADGQPLVILANDFNYQPSDYGILVPKQISVTTNLLKKDKETDRYQAVKDTTVTFDYSKFRKTNTDVKVLDDPN
ncbi:MAG: hypothetical protein ACR2LT_00825 [Pyrinomonadaceae bacterium]